VPELVARAVPLADPDADAHCDIDGVRESTADAVTQPEEVELDDAGAVAELVTLSVAGDDCEDDTLIESVGVAQPLKLARADGEPVAETNADADTDVVLEGETDGELVGAALALDAVVALPVTVALAVRGTDGEKVGEPEALAECENDTEPLSDPLTDEEPLGSGESEPVDETETLAECGRVALTRALIERGADGVKRPL